MKKIPFKLFFMLVVTLVTGLLIGKNFTSNKPVSEGKPDYFAKSQECSKYIVSVETKLKGLDIFNAKTKAETVNSLDKIFYSPKLNSCLYIATDTMYIDGKLTYETPTLTNELTGELLLAVLRKVGEKDYYTRKEQFENAVRDYE